MTSQSYGWTTSTSFGAPRLKRGNHRCRDSLNLGTLFFVNPILCNQESKTLIPEGRGSTQDHTVESKFMILSKAWILFTWEISFQLRFESPYSVLWVNPIFTLDGNKPNLGKFHPYFLPCIALDFTSDSLRSDFWKTDVKILEVTDFNRKSTSLNHEWYNRTPDMSFC